MMVSSPRTLVLVHVRPAAGQSFRNCASLWSLKDPVFKDGHPFERRLQITEHSGHFPELGGLRSSDARVFSWSGGLDDPTPPRAGNPDVLTPAERGFTGPGMNSFVLGGGNLDRCLYDAFSSIVRLKAKQGESFSAFIPVALTYWSDKVKNPLEYIMRPNEYSRHLRDIFEDGIISGYRITSGRRVVDEDGKGSPFVELKWFSVLKDIFRSDMFPEISSPAILERVTAAYLP